MSKTNDIDIIKLSKIEFPIKNFRKAGYRSYPPEWKWIRTADVSTLYYALSGTVKVTLNNINYICEKNTVFYLSKDETAVISNPSSTQKCSIFFITFEFKDGINFSDFYIERPIKDFDNRFLRFFSHIYKIHLVEGLAYKIKEFYEFSQLIYELIVYKLHSDETFQVERKIINALQYIKINYHKNITINELSKLTGYSISHFSRLFVKNCGVSPQKYILNYKIKKAKEFLLDEQDRTAEEISELLGMCNPSYFCKVFKQKTGISPHQYKKMVNDKI